MSLNDCVHVDVNPSVKIFKQTIAEYTKYAEVKKKKKISSGFEIFSKEMLEKRYIVYRETIAPPNELHWRKKFIDKQV